MGSKWTFWETKWPPKWGPGQLTEKPPGIDMHHFGIVVPLPWRDTDERSGLLC